MTQVYDLRLMLFAALLVCGRAPAQQVDSVEYQRVGDVSLKLLVDRPPGWQPSDARPAIVFFFGGGWVGGSTGQFEPQAAHLASRGFVAFRADYRVKNRHGTTPGDAVADARAAMRYVVEHATEFGVDPAKVVAAGGSAGGHLAACTAFDVEPRFVPAARVLFNPVLDTSAKGFGHRRVGAGWRELSPQHQPFTEDMPPTLILHGTGDKTVPFAQAQAYAKAAAAAGARCELARYADRGHGFFNPGRGDGKDFPATLRATEHFLGALGLLDGPPTFDLEPRAEGHAFVRLRGGLGAAFRKIEAAGKGRIAFLGGSITFNPGWRDMVAERLRERMPDTVFEFVNAGIPSFGSTPGAFRLQRDVFAGGAPDLLLVEAAVNDSTNGRSAAEMLRGMEGIVRTTRQLAPDCGIALMHFVDPSKMRQLAAGEVPEVLAVHERVADHYGLPSLDLAGEVTWRIARGEFDWKNDFRNLHPSPFGQRIYGDSISRLLEIAAAVDARPAALPEALDAASYVGGQLVDVDAVTAAGDFERVAAWRPTDGAGTRPGFVGGAVMVGSASETFAAAEWTFEGSAVGVLVAAGPDAGLLEWSVDDGDWQRVDLFTKWSRRLHLPWSHVLAAGLADGPHRLRMRVAPRTEGPGGDVARILFLLQASAVNR